MSLFTDQVLPEVKVLRIGEFSRLSQVTIKALRYYDDMGLLKPAHIDQFTGYRYYSVEQLPRIHRIIAFKELGLSLEQIATLLDDNLTSEEIAETLRRQEEQIKQRIQEEEARLAQVRFRLHMIEMEDNMPDLEVIVKPIPSQRALTVRTSIPYENLRSNLLAFQREVEEALALHRVNVVGPLTEIHYTEEFEIDYQDVEIVLPVDDRQTEDVPLETAGILKLKTVPGLPLAATYIHQHEKPDRLSEVLVMFQHWIVTNNYKLAGTHRLVHHRGALERAEYVDWIMEFQHEIAPAE